jgi:CubicO group peptidase (beta-lactamase class C family)
MSQPVVGRRRLLSASGVMISSLAASRTAFAAPPRLAPGGFAADRLARIPATLQRYVDSGAEAGFVTLLYRKGQVAQVNTIGYQDLASRAPMRRDTIFRLASMTKPVTCAAALTLVDQGKIGLHDPIARWMPEFARPRVLNRPNARLDDTHPASRPITLADLLTHRSGVAGQSAAGPQAAAVAEALKGDPTLDEWVRRFAAIPLSHDPGSRFNYGTSHDVLGALIERVSGQPLGDYLKAAIFDPLGMKDTGFWLPAAKQTRLATMYNRDPATGRLVAEPNTLPTAPPKRPRGAGGLVSTADDYLKFAAMLLNKGRVGEVRILARPTVAMMTADWLTPEQRAAGFLGIGDFWASQGFGLGVSVTDDVARHGRNPYTSEGSFGWPGRSGVWWRADPREDLVAIFMVQNPTLANATQQSAGAANAANAQPATMQLPAVIAFVNQAYAAIEV